MIRRLLLARQFSQLDVPAILASDKLPTVHPGHDRYGFHAILLVLMAFVSSIGRDTDAADHMLEMSESVYRDLNSQKMCHIWLKYLKASSGGTSSLDAAADDADVEMDRLADRLQGHDAGGWTRVIRPVV